MQRTRRSLAIAAGLAVVALSSPSLLAQQAYPSRPVQIVVPAPPDGQPTWWRG